MEQIIGLIIIYLIYSFFNAIMRKVREAASPKRPPMKPRPQSAPPQEAGPGRESPARQPQPAPAAAEPDIPPFLRELLGLEKIPPSPPTPAPEEVSYQDISYDDTPEEPEEAAPAVSELSSEAQAWEARKPIERMKVPQTGKQRAGTQAITMSSLPTGKKAAPLRSGSLISGKSDLRKAILLKEILDKPVSMRKNRFPL